MANKKTNNKLKKVVKKEVKKAAKKNPVAFIVIILILIVLAVVGFFLYKNGTFDSFFNKSNTNNNNPNPSVVYGDDELSIHFLELGNEYTGDSVFIKAGDVDILIDAGSRNASSTTISNYINNYCTDNTLEYVIATHAHQDHIAGFVGTKTNPGIFELYDCKTIIDFPKTNATSAVYNNYVTKRDQEVEAGAKHYTALECWNNENGAQRKYQLTDSISLEILYNYYYENNTSNENNYSVCVMINHESRHFLLTGDLEAEGEDKLVENNDLPKVDVYKAGHHGSYTAGSEKLLAKINPDIVCVCCCAGSTEYTSVKDNTFPAQDFINRVFKYTKEVYVTTVYDPETKFKSLNGNICVKSTKEGLVVNCSNNNTWLIDTEWFKENRVWKDE